MAGALVSAGVAAIIATCFAPEQNCALIAIGAIDAAHREVLVNAYGFTNGSGISAALIRAHDRGVDVGLIADRWTRASSKRASARWSRPDPRLDRHPRSDCTRKNTRHRPACDDRGQLQFFCRRRIQQRGPERGHFAGSRRGLRAALAGAAIGLGSLRRCLGMVPALIMLSDRRRSRVAKRPHVRGATAQL